MNRKNASKVILIVLAFLIAVSMPGVRPPVAVPASAPATEFSAERAMVYLSQIAQRPHPMGTTPEHARVRDYLMSELTRLGVNPELQSAIGFVPDYGAAASVGNVVARLPGTSGNNDAVMLAAHYDSVPAGPGAADDGSGVAVLLETLRALKAGSPLKNDVIFLFTDGEEDASQGAEAFMTQHRWAHDVRLVLNFEARGNAGASILFETSVGNGNLIRELAATPYPAGNSLMYEIYQHMPNDTDLTLMLRHGVAGMNFAYINHVEAYHSPLDSVGELDRRSLQHQGSYALTLARRFGNSDLTKLRAPNEIYFSLPAGLFVHYPASLTLPSAVFVSLLFVVVCAWMLHDRVTTWLRILLSLLAFALETVVLAAAALGFALVVKCVHLYWLPEGHRAVGAVYAACLVAVLVVIWTLLYRLFRKKLGVESFALGSLAGCVILMLLMSVYLKSGSFVLVWPVGAALASLVVARRTVGSERVSWAAILLLGGLMAPATMIVAPWLKDFFVSLGLSAPGVMMIGVVVGLLLALLAPQIELIQQPNPWLIPSLAFVAGLVLLGIGASTIRSAEHPKVSNIVYALDSDLGRSQWAGDVKRVDPWTAQYVTRAPRTGRLESFFPEGSEDVNEEFLIQEAPPVQLAPPVAVVTNNVTAGDSRVISLRISSPRHARAVTMWTDSEVLEASVNGQGSQGPWVSRFNPSTKWNLTYTNPPEAGFDLELKLEGTGPAKLILVDRSIGLPEVPGHAFAARPADVMQRHGGDQTLVRRAVSF